MSGTYINFDVVHPLCLLLYVFVEGALVPHVDHILCNTLNRHINFYDGLYVHNSGNLP